MWHKEEGVEEGETCRIIAIVFSHQKCEVNHFTSSYLCSVHTNITVVNSNYLNKVTFLLNMSLLNFVLIIWNLEDALGVQKNKDKEANDYPCPWVK